MMAVAMMAMIPQRAGAENVAHAVYCSTDSTLTFYYDEVDHSADSTNTVYNLNTGSSYPGWYVNCKAIAAVTFDESFKDARPTSCSNWFLNLENITAINNIKYLNTSEVTDMYYMFGFCTALESLDLSGFNTSKVTNMNRMFYYCKALKSLDLSNFDTSKVTDMYSMFNYCEALTSLNLSGFNTSNITDMSAMFRFCSALTSLDLRSFNTSNIKYMNEMFKDCKSLTSITFGSNFNTSNIANLSSMFNNCQSLTSLDLSGFNTSNVTNMSSMFYECEALKSLDLSNFNTSKVTSMSKMFYRCMGLTSLTLGNFDMSKVTSTSDMLELASERINLTIKSVPCLKNGTFNKCKWASVNYLLNDSSTVYTDTNYLPTATTATYTRQMDDKWETVVVPFDMTYNADNGSYKLYQPSVVSGDVIAVTEFGSNDTIVAGIPLIIKAVGNVNADEKYDVTLSAGSTAINTVITPTTAVDGLSMNGTYAKLTDQTGIYVTSANNFCLAEEAVTVKPFNAWLEGKPSTTATTLSINDDAVATVTIGDKTTLYNALDAAFAAAASGTEATPATVKMLADYTNPNGGQYFIQLTSGVMTVDLNGHTISGNSNQSVFHIDGANVTFDDSSDSVGIVANSYQAIRFISGEMTINKGTFQSTGNDYALYAMSASTTATGSIHLHGGTFNSDNAIAVPMGMPKGTNWDIIEMDGYVFRNLNTDERVNVDTNSPVIYGPVVVKEASMSDYVASVAINGDTTLYLDILPAFAAAAAGTTQTPATLTLLNDYTNPTANQYFIQLTSGVMTIDLNGHTLDAGGCESAIMIDGATVTFDDAVGTGVITNSIYYAVDFHSGDVTFNGGTYQSTRNTYYAFSAVYNTDHKDNCIHMRGGTFNAGTYSSIGLSGAYWNMIDLADGAYAFYNLDTDEKVVIDPNATEITVPVCVKQTQVPTGINDMSTSTGVKAQKVLENGQIYIITGDKKFNVMGAEVK